MKNWILPLLGLFLIGSLSAQIIFPSDVLDDASQRTNPATYRYNDQLYLDSTIFLLFNSTTDEFDRNSKTSLLYNDSGQNTESTSSEWNISMQKWEAIDRYLSTYDGDNLIEILGLRYNSGTSQWDNALLQKFTYQQSKIKTITFLDWENNEWVNETRLTYTYNSGGNTIEFLTEQWEDDMWVKLIRTRSTYDANAYLIKSVLQQWDNAWVDLTQQSYTNNDDGLPTEIVYEVSIGPNMWLPSSRDLLTYDGNENVIEERSQAYQFAMDTWLDANRTKFTYDNDNKLIQEVLEEYNGGVWIFSNRITNTYEEDRQIERLNENWENNQWVKFSTMRFYWSSNSTSVEDLKSIDLSIVMANPIMKGDMIHCHTLVSNPLIFEVYNNSGTRIASKPILNILQYQVPHDISQGMYFLIIRTPTRIVEKRKFVVQ